MPWKSVSPINLFKAQMRQHKVEDAKDAALFHQHLRWNFTAYLRVQLLHQDTYFGAILPNAVAIKSVENNLRKSCSTLEQKMSVKLTLLQCPQQLTLLKLSQLLTVISISKYLLSWLLTEWKYKLGRLSFRNTFSLV